MDTRLGSISGLLKRAREETVEVAASAAVRAVEAANGELTRVVIGDDNENSDASEVGTVAAREVDPRSRRHSTRYNSSSQESGAGGGAGLDADNMAKVEKLLGMIDSSLQELKVRYFSRFCSSALLCFCCALRILTHFNFQ